MPFSGKDATSIGGVDDVIVVEEEVEVLLRNGYQYRALCFLRREERLTLSVSLIITGNQKSAEGLCVNVLQRTYLSMNDSILSSRCSTSVLASPQRTANRQTRLTDPEKTLCNTANPHLTFVLFSKSFKILLPTSK